MWRELPKRVWQSCRTAYTWHQTAPAESNCKATRWKNPSQNRPGKTLCSQENVKLNPSLGSSSASYSFTLSLQRKDYACLCSHPVEYQKRKIDHAKRFLVWRIKNKFSWRLQLLSTPTALLSSPKFLGTEREILSSELVVLQRASWHNAAGLMLLHINKPKGQLTICGTLWAKGCWQCQNQWYTSLWLTDGKLEAIKWYKVVTDVFKNKGVTSTWKQTTS